MNNIDEIKAPRDLYMYKSLSYFYANNLTFYHYFNIQLIFNNSISIVLKRGTYWLILRYFQIEVFGQFQNLAGHIENFPNMSDIWD